MLEYCLTRNTLRKIFDKILLTKLLKNSGHCQKKGSRFLLTFLFLFWFEMSPISSPVGPRLDICLSQNLSKISRLSWPEENIQLFPFF